MAVLPDFLFVIRKRAYTDDSTNEIKTSKTMYSLPTPAPVVINTIPSP